MPPFYPILYSGPLRIHVVSKLAVDCKKKHMLRGQNPLKAFAGEDVHVCLSLSCGLAHLPLLKHSQSAKCALAIIHSTLYPFGGSMQDQVVILLDLGRNVPLIWSSLVPATMHRITGRKGVFHMHLPKDQQHCLFHGEFNTKRFSTI